MPDKLWKQITEPAEATGDKQGELHNLSQYIAEKAKEEFHELHERHSQSSELRYVRHDNRSFVDQLIPFISRSVQNKQEADVAIELILKRIEYDGPHFVAPDSRQTGYAEDAYITYVNTSPALRYAKDAAALRKSIEERVRETCYK